MKYQEKRAAPEGTWVLGGSMEIPATFYVYGARIKKVIKNADAEQRKKQTNKQKYNN